MKRIFFVLLALVALAAAPASAQIFGLPTDAYGVSDQISAVSTDVGIFVKYIGSNATTSTVAVDAATGDLAFVVAGAADPTINPVTGGAGLCGNTAGTIDVSDADCNTFGTVIDMINGSPNWIAWPGAVLRGDTSNNALNTLAATAAQNGLALLKDTIVTLNVTADVRPTIHTLPGNYFVGSPGGPYGLNPDAQKERQYMLIDASENVTCGGGAIGTLDVLGVRQIARPKVAKVAGAVAAAVSYTEVARTIWTQAGAACTNTGTLAASPLLTAPGERLLVRVNSTVALTAPQLIATAIVYKGVPIP